MSPIATGVSPAHNGTADLNGGEQVVDLAVAGQNDGQGEPLFHSVLSLR